MIISLSILYSPTAECHGVFAQYRFRCVLGELGRFREGTGRSREHVPGSMGSDRFRGPKVVLTVSDVPGFDGFWRFRRFRVLRGFQRFRDQELQKTCGTKFLPSWGWHNAAGNAVRRVNVCVKKELLNLLAVGDTAYAYHIFLQPFSVNPDNSPTWTSFTLTTHHWNIGPPGNLLDLAARPLPTICPGNQNVATSGDTAHAAMAESETWVVENGQNMPKS